MLPAGMPGDHGEKKWMLDNGINEKDITEELEDASDHYVLKAEVTSGRAYMVSQKSYLSKQS